MSKKELLKQITELPTEAQQEIADFVELVSNRYTRRHTLTPEEVGFTKKKSILENSFRGAWKDREDLQDSTRWVRELRKSRWAD